MTEKTATTVVQYIQEAKGLRDELENLSDDGTFDPANKEHAAKHKRLDELERYVYLARRRSA